MSFADMLFAASVWALPILLAVTLHEAAHGWAAWKLGDDTAHRMGRVSFNPFRHIDLFGTILMPAALLFLSDGRFMFGFAKPVPVNFMRLRNPRRDMILVAAAGPGTNLALAVIAALLFHAVGNVPEWGREWVAFNLLNSMWINLLLCVFNMLPLPPLDGGRVAVGLLPASLARPLAQLERVGIFIILGVLFILPMVGDALGVQLNVFSWLVGAPAQFLMDLIAKGVGIAG
ncbi:MAG: site-2 protease family protein [Rhodospirillales bacterium]|nr:site-2 protease family protein [Rhodospirillales bacterium]MCW8862120.1 site-2 protease family protein [Rhodospirillales bacterium]MCW8951760.1 site-2 protease family protein [Rhodospirillales bacterium]MCW8971597.1 site-2 protease family protein [Rhodospirillales bacterium]MCW9001493.1 site-2 protease family protein [Rhodospirillales bacterium]